MAPPLCVFGVNVCRIALRLIYIMHYPHLIIELPWNQTLLFNAGRDKKVITTAYFWDGLTDPIEKYLRRRFKQKMRTKKEFYRASDETVSDEADKKTQKNGSKAGNKWREGVLSEARLHDVRVKI